MTEIRPPFAPDMSLEEARDVLRPLAQKDGHDCPCCTQRVKVYRRLLTSVACRALAALYEHHHLGFAHMADVARRHLPDVAHQGGYLVLSAHWGLMVDELRRRPDGGRTGWWQVTPLGEAWLLGETTVPRYAHVFNGRCLGLHGPPISREDALGDGFDFGHLVRAPAPGPGLFDAPDPG